MSTHPYFADQARSAFTAAGGNPDNAAALAAWAQTARDRTDVHGVIVAEDGTLVAETAPVRGLNRVESAYVSTALAPEAAELVGAEVGIGTGRAVPLIGQRCVYMPQSQLCFGAGKPRSEKQPDECDACGWTR